MSSLRGRLLVGLLLGITAFLGATGVAVHRIVETRLDDALDTTLQAVLLSAVDDVARQEGRSERRESRRWPRRRSFLGWMLPEDDDVLFQAWGRGGDVLMRSEALGDADLPRPPSSLEPVPLGDVSGAAPRRADVVLDDGTPARVLSLSVLLPERPRGSRRPPRGPGGRLLRRALDRATGATGEDDPAGDGADDPGAADASPRAADDELLRDDPPFAPGSDRPPLAPADDVVAERPPARVDVVVAHDTTGLVETLAELRGLLLLGWLVSSAGCAGIVSWIVHRGLRPLDRLREQMGRHPGDDPDRRFDLDEAPRELAPVVEQLNALMARIGEAFGREQQFASAAAHELRTPLAGLRTTLELALSRPREADAWKRSAEQSLAIALEMQALVETLLDLARVGADAGRPTEPVDVAALVRGAWAAREAEAAARGLSLRATPEGAWAARSDPVLLRRLVENLVDNAVAHADAGSTVEATWGDGALVVANAASDAPADVAERAFEAFWRADAARSATGRHAGLGLALCRRVADALGAGLDASLEDGTFRVVLRLA